MLLFSRSGAKAAACVTFLFLICSLGFAQRVAVNGKGSQTVAAKPKVTQIDIEGLKKLIKPNGKPLLINFWATWCDPCREEFPDLVKLHTAYRGKVDFLTVSLDDLADIDRDVPKFLAEMKSEMPAYLLKTPDESAAISLVSKDWSGNLPMTVLIEANGNIAYQRNGKLRLETVKENLDRVLGAPMAGNGIFETIDFVKIKDGKRDEAIYFYENNWRFYCAEAIKRGVIDSYELIDARSDKDAAFDLILITRYRGEEQFKNRETAFAPIIKELTPNGLFLKGTSKPDDFRQNVSFYVGKAMFTSGK